MKSKALVIVGLLWLTILTTASGFTFADTGTSLNNTGSKVHSKVMKNKSHSWLKPNTQAINTAITNNDYTAYLAAIKGTAKEGKVTQAQFTAMVTKHQQKSAMNTAITNNDYDAYLAAIKGTTKEGKVTQAQFTSMVTKHQKELAKQQQRTAINTAITNNDYTAYLAAIKGTAKEGKVTQAQFTAMVNHMQKKTTK